MLAAAAAAARGQPSAPAPSVRIITLDPGHFHAALVQKTMYPQVDATAYVYSPGGEDLDAHLKLIAGYNARTDNPTHWKEQVYTGPDFFAKMLSDKPGNVLVLAGNNRRKTEYIQAAVEAGLNVLGDKPMAIDAANFVRLEESFATAKKKGVLLYDIMTERSEVNTELQREFSQMPDVFGKLQKGTPENPGITMESIHYFYKFVSGSALKRPAWSFDVKQQGEAIADVANHLVDLVQWECFPEQAIDYRSDIQVLSGKHWTTQLSAEEFNTVTSLKDFPDFLRGNVKDGVLAIYTNGEIDYRIKGVHAKVTALWNYKAPPGSGDSHYSMMRGTKSTLVIRQGKKEGYKPALYIEPAPGADSSALGKALDTAVAGLQSKYPGVTLKPMEGIWRVLVPEKYDVGHEAHFGQVMDRFLSYLAAAKLPEWEEPDMLAKYYTTTTALEIARRTP